MCRAQGPSQALAVAAAEVTRQLPSLAYVGCVRVCCALFTGFEKYPQRVRLQQAAAGRSRWSPQPAAPPRLLTGPETLCCLACCCCRLAVAAEDRQSVRYSTLLSQRQGAARLGAVAASSCAAGLAIDGKQTVHVRDLTNG